MGKQTAQAVAQAIKGDTNGQKSLSFWLALVQEHGDKDAIIEASGDMKRTNSVLKQMQQFGLVRRAGYVLTAEGEFILNAQRQKTA